MASTPIVRRRISTNGVALSVLTAGPLDGPLAILLHGFLDSGSSWRAQIEALAARGFRVLAPDQRGCGESACPRGVAAYTLDALAADVVGLIDALKREKAVLIGHELGGAVAWWTAVKSPERVAQLSVINEPHAGGLRRFLFTASLTQILKRWSMFFSQLWCGFEPARVRVPARLIWGTQLAEETARRTIELCDQGQLFSVEGAGHWVHHEQPERVNALLVAGDAWAPEYRACAR